MPRRRSASPSILPKLPTLLERKLYKTGQTRGADDDVIYQNRVLRCSTVLIPLGSFDSASAALNDGERFESDFIVLVPPDWYFSRERADAELATMKLTIGVNALIFYETRNDWTRYAPPRAWKPPTNRRAPLGGQYVARIPATTAHGDGNKINIGFTARSNKGAGIRVYEYADQQTIANCRIQLEGLVWLCKDAESVLVGKGMTADSVALRKERVLESAGNSHLLDAELLRKSRAIDAGGRTICPLCLDELSAAGFFTRLSQAAGREVPDITVTALNLFHVQELRTGIHNHRPYNVAWGHHHCNTVARDFGIADTLRWMHAVLERNQYPYGAASVKSGN